MSEALVLPFFNRYSSRSITQSPTGILAYGSRSDIFVIDVLENRALILDSKCIQLAHKGRVTCVSFCKNKDVELLASIGDEGLLKVWDLEAKRCVNEKQVCSDVAEWVHESSDVLFYPYDSRHLAKWLISSDSVRKIKTDSEISITIMASNKTNLLALGHHNGAITIIDIIQEKVQQKLRCHSQEISSLSWNPTSQDMLLSSSLDLTLRSWKIGEDKPVNSYHIPVGRVKPDDKKKVNVLGIWHPRKEDTAICSNFRGDLGELCLSKGEAPKFSSFANIDVNIKGSVLAYTFPKKTDQETQDLLIIFDIYKLAIWNINEKKLELQIPFLMGFVFGLSLSCINPNLLAISNGDGFLRIRNAQAESAEKNMTTIYVHYKTKIMSAAWHPIYENIIAYGTDEGRVAIIDIFKKKSMYTFETYHADKVYTVCWGPFKHLKGSKENEYFLYSCGNSNILINRLNHSKDPALNFDDFVSLPPFVDDTKKTYSEVCWKADSSCVLTGSYLGFIDLYNDNLVFLNRFSVEMKSIECLAWHPEITYASPDGSPFKFWFAASGNDSDIYLFNSTKTFVKQPQGEQNSNWESKQLVGHKKRIVSVCWSEHKDGHLASASRDGSVLIWNACTGTVLASYLHHEDNVLAVQWSVTDHDVIYSAGEDSTVRMWRISEQATINLPKKGPLKRKGRKKSKYSNFAIKNTEITLEAEKGESLESKSLIDVNENDLSDQNDDETIPYFKTGDIIGKGLSVFEKSTTESEIRQSKVQSSSNKTTSQLFPYHSMISYAPKEDELRDCMQLAKVLKDNEITLSDDVQILDSAKKSTSTLSDEDILKLGPFSDQMTALKMMEIQAEKFKQGTCRNFSQLSVMSCNVKALLEYAAVNQKLSCYLVSFAPSVSYSFWLEMCEKFAKQLLEDHQYNQACTYFLLCNKVYEAIDVCAEKIDVIEALVLAKARLPASDPKIQSLLFRVRKRYISHHSQARVAKCYLALKQPLTAAKSLFSVSDPKFMKAAIEIAKLYELEDETKKYVYLYMVKCLSLSDWNALTELMNEEPSMKVYSSLFAVHKAFKMHLKYLGKANKNLEKELFVQSDSSKPVKFWAGSTCMESKESFMKYVYHILLSNSLIPSSKEEIFDILKVLGNLFIGKETYDCVVQADVLISLCITQYIFYCVLEDHTAANFYFLKIFESSYNEPYILNAVCALLFPMSLSWNCDTHTIICESQTDNGEENNSDVVLCQLHCINQAITEEIMSYNPDYIVSKFNPKNNNPLPSVCESYDILKRKPVNEYVFAYLTANIAQNLLGLVDDKLTTYGAKKLCLSKFEKEDIERIPPLCDVETKDGSNEKEAAVNSTEDENEKIEKLIAAVLEEADEKVKFLSMFKENAASENTVDSEVSIQENKTIEETSRCFTQENKRCVDINDKKSEIIIGINPANKTELPNTEETSGNGCLSISPHIENSEITTGTNATDDTELLKKIIKEEIFGKERLKISSSDDNLHAQNLAKNDVLYQVLLFIISSITKQEFVNSYYLIENECIEKMSNLRNNTKAKVESSDELNDKINKIAVSSETMESHSSESFEMVENGEIANGRLNICEKQMNDNDNQTEQPVNYIHVELPKIIGNVNGTPSTKNNMEMNNFDQIMTEPSTDCIYNTGLFKENNAQCIPSTNTTDVSKLQMSVPNGNKMECGKSISNSENIDCHLVDSHDNSDSSEMELCSLHKTCAKSLQIVSPFGEDILRGLNINKKRIHVLISESHTSLLSYPAPFEVFQNVLKILYVLWTKSECPMIQEDLHEYMEKLVNHFHSFNRSEMKFRCEICFSK